MLPRGHGKRQDYFFGLKAGETRLDANQVDAHSNAFACRSARIIHFLTPGIFSGRPTDQAAAATADMRAGAFGRHQNGNRKKSDPPHAENCPDAVIPFCGKQLHSIRIILRTCRASPAWPLAGFYRSFSSFNTPLSFGSGECQSQSGRMCRPRRVLE